MSSKNLLQGKQLQTGANLTDAYLVQELAENFVQAVG